MNKTPYKNILKTVATSSFMVCLASAITSTSHAVPPGAAMQYQENRAIQERAQQELRSPPAEKERVDNENIEHKPKAEDAGHGHKKVKEHSDSAEHNTDR